MRARWVGVVAPDAETLRMCADLANGVEHDIVPTADADAMGAEVASLRAELAKREAEAGRVRDMRAWALSRIEWCRREEAKFSASRDGRISAGNIPVEAATERRALQAVLNQLGLAAQGEAVKP